MNPFIRNAALVKVDSEPPLDRRRILGIEISLNDRFRQMVYLLAFLQQKSAFRACNFSLCLRHYESSH